MNAAATAAQTAGVSAWLVERVADLAHGKPEELDAYLLSVGAEKRLADTLASCRCHVLLRDGNNRPSAPALAARLADECVNYCIPRSRIQEAVEHLETTGKADRLVRLSSEARELFTSLEKSGEGGEMLLYLLLESVLGLPQLLCKMPLKTSAQMHVHGADGIHGRVLTDGILELYWGEAKLYGDVSSAAKACLEDLSPFLTDQGGGAASRDLALLRDNLDLEDPALTDALRLYFTADTPEARRVRVCGAGLIGFSLDEYPTVATGEQIAADVTELVERWHAATRGHVLELELAEFQLELFLIPFPDVQTFRDTVLAELGKLG